MKKQEVKVLIASKKEAKQVKAILNGIGESVCSLKYDEKHESYYYSDDLNTWFPARETENLTAISIKDLIILLTKLKEQPQKQFIMMSEDWVSLEEGDIYFGVYKDHGKYILDQSDDDATKGRSINHYLTVKHLLGDYKVFSTKEAAVKWCEEQIKPKSITIGENSQYPVVVTATEATIKCIGDVHKDNIILWPGEINEIADALEQLNAK